MIENSKSVEDYLEAILIINQRQGYCRSVDVASQLGFSKPSVSVAVTKMEDQRLIERTDTGYISLTEEGMKIAKSTWEKHCFLVDFFKHIGVSEEIADRDSCLIEHQLSEESFNKLKKWYKETTKI